MTPSCALLVSSGLQLMLPLVAAALAHMTGLAFGPLFIVPMFVITLRISLAVRANAANGTTALPASG